MARLSKATNSTSPDSTSPDSILLLRQRYADPPALWAIVAVGSLAIHAVLLLGMRWFNLQVSLAQPEIDSIPIEMVDVTPALSTTAPAPINSAPSPPAQQTAVPDVAAPYQPIDRPRIGAIASPRPATNPGSTAIAPPQTPSNPRSQSTPISQPTGSPSPPLTSNTPLPSDQTGNQTGNQVGNQTDNQVSNQTGNNGSTSTPPGNNPGAPSPDQNNTIPSVTVAQQAAPARVKASLSVSPIPASEHPTDLIGPDGHLAQPKDPAPIFPLDPTQSDCVLDPSSFNFLGTSLEFYVEIETIDPNTGSVVGEPRLRGNSSGSDSYDHLAACLLKHVAFHPAFTTTPTGNVSPPASEVIVQIKIDMVSN